MARVLIKGELCTLLVFLALAQGRAHGFNDSDDKWTTVLSAGVSAPLISSQLESYSQEGDLDAYGVGIHFEYHGIYDPNKLCLVAKGGVALAQVSSEGSYEDYEGSALYFMCGLGREFKLGPLALTPALGLGFEYLDMEAEYHVADYTVEDTIEVGMVCLCADLQLALMFSPSFGLSASCLVMLPFFGDGEAESHTRGYFDKEDIDTAYTKLNIIPAVCFVWRI